MKKKQKTNAKGRRCSGTVEVSPKIKRVRLLSSQSNAHAQVNGLHNRAFPLASKLQWVTVMSQRKGGKRCLYRDTSSPGLTPTRRRSVRRQGATSPP